MTCSGCEYDPAGRELRHADQDGLLAIVQQPVHHAIPAAHQPVASHASGQPEVPPRADLHPHLNLGGGAQGPGLAITCTSTRNVRLATIGSPSTGRR